jgi:hypothetical protein
MDYSKILLGILFGIIGQVGTFLQLQGGYKYGWYNDYKWIIILASVPLGWVYIQSVNYFISGFGGQIYPSRLIGFSVGIVIFVIMSYFLFNEPLTMKNILSIILAFFIVLIQVFL